MRLHSCVAFAFTYWSHHVCDVKHVHVAYELHAAIIGSTDDAWFPAADLNLEGLAMCGSHTSLASSNIRLDCKSMLLACTDMQMGVDWPGPRGDPDGS